MTYTLMHEIEQGEAFEFNTVLETNSGEVIIRYMKALDPGVWYQYIVMDEDEDTGEGERERANEWMDVYAPEAKLYSLTTLERKNHLLRQKAHALEIMVGMLSTRPSKSAIACIKKRMDEYDLYVLAPNQVFPDGHCYRHEDKSKVEAHLKDQYPEAHLTTQRNFDDEVTTRRNDPHSDRYTNSNGEGTHKLYQQARLVKEIEKKIASL